VGEKGNEVWIRRGGKRVHQRTREGSTAETSRAQILAFLCVKHFSLRVSGSSFLGFSCILRVSIGSVRLRKSGLWDWVLLYALLLDRLHKLWQIQLAAVMQKVLGTLVFSLFQSLQHLVLRDTKAILHL